MEHLTNDHKHCPNENENSLKLCDEAWHAEYVEFDEKLKETETTTWSEFTEGEPLQNK